MAPFSASAPIPHSWMDLTGIQALGFVVVIVLVMWWLYRRVATQDRSQCRSLAVDPKSSWPRDRSEDNEDTLLGQAQGSASEYYNAQNKFDMRDIQHHPGVARSGDLAFALSLPHPSLKYHEDNETSTESLIKHDTRNKEGVNPGNISEQRSEKNLSNIITESSVISMTTLSPRFAEMEATIPVPTPSTPPATQAPAVPAPVPGPSIPTATGQTLTTIDPPSNTALRQTNVNVKVNVMVHTGTFRCRRRVRTWEVGSGSLQSVETRDGLTDVS